MKSLLLFGLILLASCSQSNRQPNETDFCSKIHRNDSISLSQALQDISHLMLSKTGVYVLEDGAGSMVARAWLSEYAEKTIDIQYFIFSLDNIGLIACDYLVRAADRGVKIRILVDDVMVDAKIEDILKLDAHPNIDIKVYNPGLNLGKNIYDKIKKLTTSFRSANQRMHNKVFLVDGKICITGGRNIADEYFDYDHSYNFRDRDVLLLGSVNKNVNSSFNEFWNSDLSVHVSSLTHKKPTEIQASYAKLHAYACNPENFWPQVRTRIEKLPLAFKNLNQTGKIIWLDSVYYVSDIPGKNNGQSGLKGGGISTDALIALVQQAKHTVDIQTPYLITTELSRNLFREAIEMGVKVRILTNSLASTDNTEAFSAYQKDRDKLIKMGIQLFEFRPDAAAQMQLMTDELHTTLAKPPIFGLHAKSMVVDGKITVIGTFNLDPRSANLNTECITIIHSEQIALRVLTEMENEFSPENSWRISENFNPDHTVSKAKRIKTWSRKILPKDIL